jgi:lambda repressor-like predicted transcriptional regulator
MIPEKAPRKRAAYGLPADMETFLRTTQDIQMMLVKGIRQDGSLKPEAIFALLKLKQVYVRTLAETHGYSREYFRQVINRERKDIKVENIIAEKLHLEANRMWGRRMLEAVNA